MKFEVSEQIHMRADTRTIVDALELQFRKIARRTDRTGELLRLRNIEASFGSINRSDQATISVQQKNNGFLCVAEVTYRPSIAFWIFFMLGLFAYGLFFWIPIIFYLAQKKTVRSAITDVFARVKNEFELDVMPYRSNLADLERLASLKGNGILTEAEFENQKREILGAANAGIPSTGSDTLSSVNLALVESYLQRRSGFEPEARQNIRQQIAEHIRAQTGLYHVSGQSLDDFLERLAGQRRSDTAK